MSSVKKLSQKQERKVAKDLNAKTVVASGALWGAKGDVRNEHLLVECKYTKSTVYPLVSTVWKKIKKEAIRDGLRIPVMCIEIAGKSFAVVEKSLVDSYILHSNQLYYTRRITAKSFDIHSTDPNWLYVYCDNPAWGSPPERLMLIYWEDFLEVIKEIGV